MSDATEQELAFSKHICEHPEDNNLRLIYADWLEEHGNDARAEFIRIQIALASIPNDDSRQSSLRGREQQLLFAHRREWEEPYLRGDIAFIEDFRCGFPEFIWVFASNFVKNGNEVFDVAPIRNVRIIEWDNMTTLANCPHFRRLKELDLVPLIPLDQQDINELYYGPDPNEDDPRRIDSAGGP